MDNKLSNVIGAVAGACVLTLLHQTLRKIDNDAPRMDLLGNEAIKKVLHMTDTTVPGEETLSKWSFVGDIVSNSLYYGLAGIGDRKNISAKGTALGMIAGLGATVLPKYLGLSDGPSNKTIKTKLMTIGLYLIGGVVASATMKSLGTSTGIKYL